ncbi:UNVERIFIED_CONTAM: CalpA [Trichonephila clavipes]
MDRVLESFQIRGKIIHTNRKEALPDPNIVEMEMSNGLIRGHAYSITKVKLVEVQTPRVRGKIPLLRIRNPWGNECEWRGAWSDRFVTLPWTLLSAGSPFQRTYHFFLCIGFN